MTRQALPVASGAVEVAVHASDPLTGLGAADLLRQETRVAVLDEDDLASAEVIVVVEESITDGILALLRRARENSRRDPAPRCVFVTDDFRPDLLMTALECGLAAVLPRRDTGGDELARTVLAVSRGAGCLPPRLQGILLSRLDGISRTVLEPNGLTLSGLSARERDVLRLLAEGHRTEEVATLLVYSESTVKNVLYGLMKRHGLATRAHAVAFAVRSGVI
ncbi:helix-turn-helix transcriptional regulator [Prauserella cavernicola]|uniref:helix-turn-helix transcriptional regulator n=1 Tax=Prauserella cavernicola TaxID=2800127 RepID=UPI0027DC1EAD|nr:response regulator transcription factor [Prauserella cavernicola]